MIWFLLFCVYDEPSADLCLHKDLHLANVHHRAVKRDGTKYTNRVGVSLLDCGERRSARGRLCGGFRKRIGVKSIVQGIPMSL